MPAYINYENKNVSAKCMTYILLYIGFIAIQYITSHAAVYKEYV